MSVALENVLSDYGAATSLNGESLGNQFFVSFYLYYICVFLFMKVINMFRVGILPPQPLFEEDIKKKS